MPFFESLTKLKEHLGIKPINTGQQFNFRGIVFDDVEALHARTSINGDCVNLVSGVEFAFTEYRGQTQEYESCLSTLDRIQHDHELFAALCRSTYFKQALEAHPVITQIRSKGLNLGENGESLPICVDLDGIAQHYGLPTQYLDITSNFSVASFFATQRWDNKAKKFEPMRMTPKPGVIYQLQPAFLIAQDSDNGIPYTPIGWQPFPRPEQQRANAIRLPAGEDFVESLPVASHYFNHSRNQSKRIYEEFEGGEKLLPADDLADFAESVQSKTNFPQHTLDEAFRLYEKRRKPQDTANKRQSLMARAGITLEYPGDSEAYRWNFSQQAFDAEIQRMLGRVRSRWACYAQ